MIAMIDTRPLRHLIAVASYPTVQAAADSLHLTQPALTKSISRFEDSIGAKLFDRRGHRLVLTELGQRLVTRGESIMRQLRDVEEEITLWNGLGTGEVDIGVDPGAELSLLPIVLQSFVPLHPKVQIRIRSGHTQTLLPALLAGELHFLVADTELADAREDLLIHPLSEEELAPAIRPGHPLVNTPAINPNEVLLYPIVGSSTAPRFERWREERGTQDTGKPFVTSVLCGNFEVLIRLAEQSDAIVFGPRELLSQYELAGRLKIMPWNLDGPTLRPSLIRSKERPLSPAAETLFELFLSTA